MVGGARGGSWFGCWYWVEEKLVPRRHKAL